MTENSSQLGIGELLTELCDYVAATDAQYAANKKSGVTTYPIPFFGNLPDAEVVTVGLNPSATEFQRAGWDVSFTPALLAHHLVHYFERGHHPWFESWEAGLALIGASYKRNAAHLDLSPRATVSAAAAPDLATFEQMIAADLPWALRFLERAPHVRLVLLAGAVSKRYYMNEFLAKHLPAAGAWLEGKVSRPPGSGKVLRHSLVLRDRRIPVWFCSSSPSDRRNDGLLLSRIKRDADELKQAMASGHW